MRGFAVMNTLSHKQSDTRRTSRGGRTPRFIHAARLAGVLLLVSIGSGAASSEEGAPVRGAATKATAARGAATRLTDIKATRETDRLVVSIVSDGPVAHQDFVLTKPPRLVMDLRNVENRVPFATLPF